MPGTILALERTSRRTPDFDLQGGWIQMAIALIAGANPHGRELARRLLTDRSARRRLI